MKIIADANVLIRAAVQDDVQQAKMAVDVLRRADKIALTIPALCEFIWVLEQGYRRPRQEVARSIRALISDRRASFDRAAVFAGLAIHDAGGDFADGVIAFEGRRLGAAVFTTFDRKAAQLVRSAGGEATLLGQT